MSILPKPKITFGIAKDNGYGQHPSFEPKESFACRFFDKKEIAFDQNDEFLNYDKVAIVENYKEVGELAFFENVYYKIEGISSLQNFGYTKTKTQIKLKITTL